MIDRQTVDKILDAAQIVDVVSDFVTLRKRGVNYIGLVNSSAASGRPVKEIEGTQFCSPDSGFSILTADKKSLCLHMINKKGKVIHTVTKTK